MNCILTIFSTLCQAIKTPSRCRNDSGAPVTERAALAYKGGEMMSRDRRRRGARGGRARGGFSEPAGGGGIRPGCGFRRNSEPIYEIPGCARARACVYRSLVHRSLRAEEADRSAQTLKR